MSIRAARRELQQANGRDGESPRVHHKNQCGAEELGAQRGGVRCAPRVQEALENCSQDDGDPRILGGSVSLRVRVLGDDLRDAARAAVGTLRLRMERSSVDRADRCALRALPPGLDWVGDVPVHGEMVMGARFGEVDDGRWAHGVLVRLAPAQRP